MFPYNSLLMVIYGDTVSSFSANYLQEKIIVCNESQIIMWPFILIAFSLPQNYGADATTCIENGVRVEECTTFDCTVNVKVRFTTRQHDKNIYGSLRAIIDNVGSMKNRPSLATKYCVLLRYTIQSAIGQLRVYDLRRGLWRSKTDHPLMERKKVN